MKRRRRGRSRGPHLERLECREVPAAMGHAWPIPHALSVSFVPDGTRIGSYASDLQGVAAAAWGDDWQLQVLSAFQAWTAGAGINFGLTADSGDPLGAQGFVVRSAKFGDIRVAAHPMPLDVVAYAVPFDPSAGTWSGDLILNSAYASRPPGSPDVDLYSVVLHEAGHILGLPDGNDPTSVLFESYNGERRRLSEQDARSARALYGARMPDAYEGPAGNETLDTAAPVVVGPWGPAEGVLADLQSASDVDVYRVSIPVEAERLTIRLVTAGISFLTAAVTVRDSEGRVVGSAVTTDPRAGLVEIAVPGPVAGRDFFVEVRGGSDDSFAVGSYAMVADTADGMVHALDRLMFKAAGAMYILSGLESGRSDSAEAWAPVLRVLFEAPPAGHPPAYTAALGAVIDQFLAVRGERPFDLEAFSRLGEEVSTLHAGTLLEPGLFTAILRVLDERGALDSLVRDVWDQADLRGALHAVVGSGTLGPAIFGMHDPARYTEVARDIWTSEGVREEVLGLLDSGRLDGMLAYLAASGQAHDLLAAAMPVGVECPTDPAALRRMARGLLMQFGSGGKQAVVVAEIFRAMLVTDEVQGEFLRLLQAGALDHFGRAIMASEAVGQVSAAVLAAASRTDPTIMAALIGALFPAPNVAFETARGLAPLWAALRAESSYLSQVATTDSRGRTVVRVDVPGSGEAQGAMTVSVLELTQHGSRPVLRVYDAAGRPVSAEVLDASDGSFLVQVRDPVPGATYFIEVVQVVGEDAPGSGLYFISASFEDHVEQFERVASGRTPAGGASLATYTAPETQLVHWVLSARGEADRAGGAVRLTVVDASGVVIYSATAVAGQDVGLALHLPHGSYSLIFESEGAGPAGLAYELRGQTLSDSLNPYREDTSLAPVGGVPPSPSVPPTPRAGGADGGVARAVAAVPGGRIAILGPMSAPHLCSFGAEGPAGTRHLAVAPGLAGRRPSPTARVGRPADPTSEGRPAPSRLVASAPRVGVGPALEAATSGGDGRADVGRSAAPVVLASGRLKVPTVDEAAGGAAAFLPHDLAVEALGEAEGSIEIRASEAVVAALLAGGASRIVARRRSRKPVPSGPVSAFGQSRGRSAGRRRSASRPGGPYPGSVLLIRTSLRPGSSPIRRWLEADGVVVHEAGPTTWNAGLPLGPDLILLQHDPRTRGGADLLLRIKEIPSAAAIPVIIFSEAEAGEFAEDAAEGLDLGAADVLPRSVTAAEFRARVRRAMRLRREFEGLERVAASDGLTGLCNRSALEGRLAAAWCDCRRLYRPLGLLIADLDHFKEVNDTCGHPTGDEVLRRVAAALEEVAGPSGFAARYGGEEFVVVVPGGDRAGVLRLAEGIRRRVGELAVSDLGLPRPITISVGVAWTGSPHRAIPTELLARADRALYEAKAAGRDSVRM